MTTSTFEKLPFSKYKGQTIEEIYQSDPGYLRWMAKEDICYRGIFYGRRAANHLKQQEQKQESEQSKTIYKCSECGKQSNYAVFIECPFCTDPLCGTCLQLHDEMHRKARAQKTEQGEQKQQTKHHCTMCGVLTTTECDECKKPYCSLCFTVHNRAKHQNDPFNEFWRQFRGEHTTSSNNGTYTHTFTPPNRPPMTREMQAAFKTLELPPAATVQEVKHAFRAKAKIAHPDTGGSEQAFKALNAAYQLVLSYAERNK